MPATNRIFEGRPEPLSPFLEGFEKLQKKSKESDLVHYVSGTHYNKRIIRLGKAAKVAANRYFSVEPNPVTIDARAKSLALGLLIGLHAGRISVPRIARPHFLDNINRMLSPDSDSFRGYHTDMSTLELQVSDQFRTSSLTSKLPDLADPSAQEALVVGFGWMAQQVHDYHLDKLDLASPYALWKSRNEDERGMQKELHAISRAKPADFL